MTDAERFVANVLRAFPGASVTWKERTETVADRRTLDLTPANAHLAHQGVDAAIRKGLSGDRWVLELRERTRTDDQNDALHGLIAQILKQRPHLNGLKMTKESYKATFMQALGHEMPMLPTLAGDGFFPAGLRTSKLTVGEFSDLIEFILAWCAEQGLTITHFDGSKGGGAETETKNRAPEAA